MTKEKNEYIKTMTPVGRCAFANVWKPKAIQEGQEAKYSLILLFDKKAQESTEYKTMKELVMQCIVKKWGADKTKWPANLRNPFRKAEEKPGYQGFEAGMVFISASSKDRPGVVDLNATAILNQEDFYSGCYARATINVFAYDKLGNRGVSFGLNNIQKYKDGEKFSGKTRAEDDFTAIKPDETLASSEFGADDLNF
jgi:hypothetical protein